MSYLHKEYNNYGFLLSEVFINNGLKEGIYKEYYKDGTISEEYNYINNKKNGIYKKYYRDGSISLECVYIDDNIVGECLFYDPQGLVWTEKHFDNNGNIIIEINYLFGNIIEIKLY
jgi:antitoxin component YwqK of YwqJK toxin-antitoxin module